MDRYVKLTSDDEQMKVWVTGKNFREGEYVTLRRHPSPARLWKVEKILETR